MAAASGAVAAHDSIRALAASLRRLPAGSCSTHCEASFGFWPAQLAASALAAVTLLPSLAMPSIHVAAAVGSCWAQSSMPL